MAIGSDLSKLPGYKATRYMPGMFKRPLLGVAVVFFSQLTAIGFTHADQRIASTTEISAHGETGEQRTTDEGLTITDTGESLGADARNEVHCLALNIYFEARSEPEKGQRAVAHVVMNRVAHPRYPDSVCEVVQQGGEKVRHRCQFSWWCDGLSDKPVNQKAWEKSLRLAQKIYLGILEDTTDGALWYHATYVTPYWSKTLLQGDKIGQHIFYLENRQSSNTM